MATESSFLPPRKPGQGRVSGNPGAIHEAQIEGNLIWELGMALMERVEIGQSEISSLNFDRYVVPRIHDVPEFDIEIVSPRHVPPAGAGETAPIVGPPANALRQATGRRYTALPIRSAGSST